MAEAEQSMEALRIVEQAKNVNARGARLEQLEEPWFDEPPPSVVRRPSEAPVVHVGEFLGDPLADAWLR